MLPGEVVIAAFFQSSGRNCYGYNAAANVRTHRVQFSEAAGVFSDDYAIAIHDDESDPDEQRFVTLGMGIKGGFW